MILYMFTVYLVFGIVYAILGNIPKLLSELSAYRLLSWPARWLTVVLCYAIVISGWLVLTILSLRRGAHGGDIDS